MRKLTKSLCTIVSIGLAAGCATVDPKPFSAFADSIRTANSGLESAMQLALSNSREEELQSMALNPKAEFSLLPLSYDKNYSITADPKSPDNQLEMRNAQKKLTQITGLLSKYSTLLYTLADAGLSDANTFKNIATEMNSNVKTLTTDLGKPLNQNGLEIFSAAATDAIAEYVNSKKKDDLKKALSSNQTEIKKISDHCVKLVRKIREALKTAYDTNTQSLIKQWEQARSQKTRLDALHKMVALNDTFSNSMSILENLDKEMQAIPGAHIDLAKSLDDPKGVKANLDQLVNFGQNLQQLYQQVKSSQGGS